MVSISGPLLLTDSVTVAEEVSAGEELEGVVTVDDEEVVVVVVTEPLAAGTDRAALVLLVVDGAAGLVDTEGAPVAVVVVEVAVVEVADVSTVAAAGLVEPAAGLEPFVAMSVGVPNSLVSSTKAAIG